MNTPRGERTHRKVTAYHEAGHALAALREGRSVREIVVSVNRPGDGFCLNGREKRNPYDVTINQRSAQAAWFKTVESTCSDIRIALAGPLAEARFVGKPLRALGSKSDLDSCIYQLERLTRLRSFMLEYIEVKPFDPEQIFEAEKRRIRRWLARPEIWSAAMLVSCALFHERNLSGRVLNNIIGVVSALRGQRSLNF